MHPLHSETCIFLPAVTLLPMGKRDLPVPACKPTNAPTAPLISPRGTSCAGCQQTPSRARPGRGSAGVSLP